MGLGTGPGMYVCSLTPRGLAWELAWEPAWECMCVASLPGDWPVNQPGNVCVCVYSCSQSRDEPGSSTEFMQFCCFVTRVRHNSQTGDYFRMLRGSLFWVHYQLWTQWGYLVAIPCIIMQSCPTQPCSLPTGLVTGSNTTPTGCVNVGGSQEASFCKTNLWPLVDGGPRQGVCFLYYCSFILINK